MSPCMTPKMTIAGGSERVVTNAMIAMVQPQ